MTTWGGAPLLERAGGGEALPNHPGEANMILRPIPLPRSAHGFPVDRVAPDRRR